MSTEVAWAAGFFDGEGNASLVNRRGQWKGLLLAVAQVKRGPLERFHAAVGGVGWIHGPYGIRRCYMWRCMGVKPFGQVTELLWPYLCEPKREQITDVIDRFLVYQQTLTHGRGVRRTSEQRERYSAVAIERWRKKHLEEVHYAG